MSARSWTAAAILVAAVTLTGCATADPADDDARAAISASFEQTGWASDLSGDELAAEVDYMLDRAHDSCDAGGYTPNSEPAAGAAVIAAMGELCPEVTP